MRKMGLYWGYVGSHGAPQGPRWLIYAPMAQMKWVENKTASLAILGWMDRSLSAMRVDKEN